MGGKDRVTVLTVLRGTLRRGHPRMFFRQAYGDAAVPALGVGTQCFERHEAQVIVPP